MTPRTPTSMIYPRTATPSWRILRWTSKCTTLLNLVLSRSSPRTTSSVRRH
jgi:hypothetical protein